jgi:hypothetical protein
MPPKLVEQSNRLFKTITNLFSNMSGQKVVVFPLATGPSTANEETLVCNGRIAQAASGLKTLILCIITTVKPFLSLSLLWRCVSDDQMPCELQHMQACQGKREALPCLYVLLREHRVPWLALLTEKDTGVTASDIQ